MNIVNRMEFLTSTVEVNYREVLGCAKKHRESTKDNLFGVRHPPERKHASAVNSFWGPVNTASFGPTWASFQGQNGIN